MTNDHDRELRRQWAAQLDAIGVENVRIQLSGNVYIPNIDRSYAWEWLRAQDQVSRSGDRRVAMWTLAASVLAAIAGIAAVAVGIMGLK
jgi:hypothetical protein